MAAREVELLRLDVDPEQLQPGKFLAQHRQHGADTATDLEHPRPGFQLRAIANHPLPPVLGLRDQPLLFGRRVAVDVIGHGPRLQDLVEPAAPA